VLFRIAQEALTNIERHAGAASVTMTLARGGRRLCLLVADDGAGFDAEGIAVHPQRGIGLRNMVERMDAIGGELNIESSALGTTVRASVELTE
jgi:two-component system NarL family sensor kinase